jgi:hypothetical protein
MDVTPDQPVFLVLRTIFEDLGSGLQAAPHAADEGDPVRAFADRGRAEAWREEMDELERRKGAPFWFARNTEAANAVLAAQARDRGLVPPSLAEPHGYDPATWSWWWQKVALGQPADEVGGLWDDFGGGRFFEVAAVPLEGDEPYGGESLYIVRRITWVRDDRAGLWHRRSDHSGRIVFGRPARAVADRNEAEACRARAERQDRTGHNPFDYVMPADDDPIVDRTSLDYPRLHDWLLDCGAPGVPRPTATVFGWRRWWVRTMPLLAPLQQAKAWEAFDRVRLYDVVDAPWDEAPV